MSPQIEKLQKEREENEAKIKRYELKEEQLDHQLQRAENKLRFESKKERDRRTITFVTSVAQSSISFPYPKT